MLWASSPTWLSKLQVVKFAFITDTFPQHPPEYCKSPAKSSPNKPHFETLRTAVWAGMKRFTTVIKTTSKGHFTCELWQFRDTYYAYGVASRKKKTNLVCGWNGRWQVQKHKESQKEESGLNWVNARLGVIVHGLKKCWGILDKLNNLHLETDVFG